MLTDTGDSPVTICPPGVAAGIDLRCGVKQTSRKGYRPATEYSVSFLANPLRRLARAKIAQALIDLNCHQGAGHTYNRIVAVQFLSSYEMVIWCDMADISVSMVRRRAAELGLKDKK